MKYLFLIFVSSLWTIGSACAQCKADDRNIINNNFDNFKYTGYCPAYCFAPGGDTSKHWNILSDAIDIEQAPYLKEMRQRLELKIRNFAGDLFFSRLKLYQAEVSLPDSISKFDTRHPKCDLSRCKAKYFFYYYFMPNDSVKYCIGIPLDEKENILSEFNFPSKNEYRTVDSTLAFCSVIEIAKKADPKIRPIQSVSFDYDEKTKRYYWTVSQKIRNFKPGKHFYRMVLIDASDKTKIEKKRGEEIIYY